MKQYFNYEDELTPYKKKRGKRKISKSNHKHLYEKCLVEDEGCLTLGKYCTVCDKVEITNFCISVPVDNGRLYRMITNNEEARSLYPDLPIKKLYR